MLTREQLESDIEFLALRAKRAGGWYGGQKRDWGISSNSLVSYAYGVGFPEMPSDWDDFAACVRLVRRLPRHRRTSKILTALSIQKTAVERKYPASVRRASARRKAAA